MAATTKHNDQNEHQDIGGRLVCIVDDDEIFRSYLAIILKSAGLNVEEFADGAGLTSYLTERTPDCILLDYNLASESGLYVHEQLKARFTKLPPVVMITADEGQRTAIRAFRVGVDDFIPKRNLRQEDVVNAVRRSIDKFENAQSQNSEIARLRQDSTFDELTGHYSRRELDQKLAVISGSAQKSGARFIVIGVAFVQYETIASHFGVTVADRLLRSFSARLKAATRSEDFCGRYGGETFYYVVDVRASPAVAREQADRLAGELSFSEHVKSARITLSAVVSAALFPDEGDTVDQISAVIETDLHRQLATARSLNESGSERWIVGPTSDNSDTGQGWTDGEERRRSARVRTLKKGSIIFNDGSSTIDCTIRNISEHGARIRVDSALAIPEQFRLQIGENGTVRRVHKIWQMNNELGVEFNERS